MHIDLGWVFSNATSEVYDAIFRHTGIYSVRGRALPGLVIGHSSAFIIGVAPDGACLLSISNPGAESYHLTADDPRLSYLLNRNLFLHRWWERMNKVVFSARVLPDKSWPIYVGEAIEDDRGGLVGEEHPEWAQITRFTPARLDFDRFRHVLYLVDPVGNWWGSGSLPHRVLGVRRDERTGAAGLLVRSVKYAESSDGYSRDHRVIKISNLEAFAVMQDALLQSGEIDE